MIHLARAEYRVLQTLLAAPNRPVSREQLNAHLPPFTRSRGAGTLDVTIGRLRRKVGAGRLRTIRGIGYQLIDERPPAIQVARPRADVHG